MTRLKQNRTRRSGYRGSMNAQDFVQCTISHADLCRQNARTCYNILSGHVGKLNDEAMERRLADALAALTQLGEV